MSSINISEQLFFQDLDKSDAENIVNNTLESADDGELYLEYSQSESMFFEDGTLKKASFDTEQGFGLRAVSGETVGYGYGNEINSANLKAASDIARTAVSAKGGKSQIPMAAQKVLYRPDNPLESMSFNDKINLLKEIDAYTRHLDKRIQNVTIGLSANWKVVGIMRQDGHYVADIRPLVRLAIQAFAKKGDRQESGYYGCGGRYNYDVLLKGNSWEHAAEDAVRQALVNLDAVQAPAGEMEVILAHGWPGVLLHEAVGHGLEGDFNRKKTSAFAELMGKKVAAKGVTVVDDGTIPDCRGSLTFDDEGTPTQRNVLIEDGILTGYMQDRLNARLMKTQSTGNGRRESYAHEPMPRMTNTFMVSGDRSPEEIIKSTKKGLYAANFSGGQVDITNGQFVFSATEAYLVENGKITHPVKGATLIGNGPNALTKISMIGNDSQLDTGTGMCGKDGQMIPVGVGMPTTKIANMTVGGTQV